MKKIGLTALAASLVSVSANAGELTVSGAASIGMSGYSADKANMARSFTMGNQITFSGGGELDNGMNVSLSFVIDQADDTLPFDGHSLTVSSEGMGTLVFHGEGGGSAASSIDGSVAGDIWDGYDSTAYTGTGITGTGLTDTGPGDNSVFYTLPSLMDGVSIFTSYNPTTQSNEAEIGYGVTYTAIDGLTASFATTDKNTGTNSTSGDQTSWKVSYAYGPVTVGASSSEYDVNTSSSDRTLDAYSIAYTISDELSISYGAETLEKGGATTDAEYTAIVASYTSGGMTITAKLEDAENVDNTTTNAADQEHYFLGAAFAF
jgi:outer membrane protein OmpU